MDRCKICENPDQEEFRCQVCGLGIYCSKEHAEEDWAHHRSSCREELTSGSKGKADFCRNCRMVFLRSSPDSRQGFCAETCFNLFYRYVREFKCSEDDAEKITSEKKTEDILRLHDDLILYMAKFHGGKTQAVGFFAAMLSFMPPEVPLDSPKDLDNARLSRMKSNMRCCLS